MMICFWQNTFWAKTSLSFVFRGPNSAHPEVFRYANHNGTSFKAVWWSVSEKTHFGLKHHFPLYLEGQTHYTLRFSGMPMTWYKFQSCMMTCFWQTHFGLKHHFPLYLEGQTHCTLRLSGVLIAMVQVSKLYDDLISEKTHFGLKHHFLLYSEGQTQCVLRFSGVLLPMVQVSKLFNDPFLRKHLLG